MKQLLILFLCLLLLNSCEKGHWDDCITSNGKIKTDYREFKAFSTIELDDRIDLDLIWDSIYSIKVEAGSGIIDNIVTEIKEDKLSIFNVNKCNFVRSYKKKIKVTVSSNLYHEIIYRGSGTINCLNQIKSDIFKLDCWEASGNISLDLKSKESYIKSHTGPTTITVKGSTDYSVLYLKGVGEILAQNYSAYNSYVINTNTGEIFQSTQNILDAFIESKGDIYSYGVPNTLNLTKTGSGNYYQR